MVERALLEQVLCLDASDRREVIAVLESSLDDGDVSPEVAALVRQCVAEADAHPEQSITLEAWEREVQERYDA